MKLFLHLGERIRIINEPLEWAGTLAEFLMKEPSYPGLPTGATIRYHTPDLQYYEDSAGRHTDQVNCLQYCDRVTSYLVSGCIYVHVTLGSVILNVDDAQASIPFEAHIKPTSDPNSPDLPVYDTWIIRPYHETGDRDSLHIEFVNGSCAYTYRYREVLPIGDWFIREEDFSPVTVGATTYRVKLAAPVKFTLYRNLE